VRRFLSVVGIVLLLFGSVNSVLSAQSAAVGASYTLLSLTYPDDIAHGFGGWISWDGAGGLIGLDVGINGFPDDHPTVGRQTQLLAGVRSGIRTGKVGVFGRLRPGIVHFSRRFIAPDIGCIAIFPTPEACLAKSNNFALDLGGTVEFYPSSASLVRIDLGDTLIRFERTALDPSWKNNFQFAAGAGLRF
jgi:hypothetical protein